MRGCCIPRPDFISAVIGVGIAALYNRCFTPAAVLLAVILSIIPAGIYTVTIAAAVTVYSSPVIMSPAVIVTLVIPFIPVITVVIIVSIAIVAIVPGRIIIIGVITIVSVPIVIVSAGRIVGVCAGAKPCHQGNQCAGDEQPGLIK